MTPKQKRFVDEYLVDLNATAAAKRAGYNPKTAYSIGQENLTKPEIQSAIQEAKANRQKRTEITQDMVIAELAKLGFFDIRKLFDRDGKPLDVIQLDGDTAAALVGLDVQDVADPDGAFVGYVKKYKMADKIRALELLGKHLGVFASGGSAAAAEENNIFEVIKQSTQEKIDVNGIPEIEPSAEPGDDVVE